MDGSTEAGGISRAGDVGLLRTLGEGRVDVGEELPSAGLPGPGITTSTEYFGWVPTLGPYGTRTGLSRRGGVGLREVCSSWTTLSIVGVDGEIRWRLAKQPEGSPSRCTNSTTLGAHNLCYKSTHPPGWPRNQCKAPASQI